MRLKYVNKKISGVLLVLPEKEQSFLDDMKKFEMPESRSLKLMELMGYDKHRLVEPNVCSSDLVVAGLRYLIRKGLISIDKIDALIVVTQTPDYLIPPTSSVIQGELGLKQDMICLDINQGCAGYLVGLMQAFSLLEQDSINNVILANVDVLSRKVSERDRNSFPLIGDAAAITMVSSEKSDQIWANIKTDGTRREALMIPAGGMKIPSSTKTSVVMREDDNNFRSLDNLRMDGTAVFNFVQTEVPPLILDLFTFSNKSDDNIFGYAFHQPNRFMLEKLADKLKIHPRKMPMDVVQRFGNSSGVTIPTVLATNFSEALKNSNELYCLSGFGVGLTWASMILNIGPLEFCERITYDGE